MKKIFLVLQLLVCIKLSGQIDTTLVSYPKIPKSKLNYLKVENRISYRYPCFDYSCRNIRLRYEENKLFYDSLDNENEIVYSVSCILVANPILFQLGVDSISIREVNKEVLGIDTTWPNMIYRYIIKPQRQGKYTEYYSDGMVKIVGYYNLDYKSKKWRFYNERGKLIAFVKYQNDIIIKQRYFLDSPLPQISIQKNLR